MPEIYSSAAQVLIHVGESAESSDLAMDHFANFGCQQDIDNPTLTAIHAFFQRPWFERIWVIQEVAMSNSALVLCGAKSVSWAYVVASARKLLLKPPILSPINRLQQRGWMHMMTTDEFVKSLCESTQCKCRDPRDRIFAFISMRPTMMTGLQIEELKTSGFPLEKRYQRDESYKWSPPGTKEFKATTSMSSHTLDGVWLSNPRDVISANPLNMSANYAISTEYVYVKVANVLINCLGLDLLSAMQGHQNPGTLPSWVPDWRVSQKRTILAHIPLSGYQAGGLGPRPQYHSILFDNVLGVSAARIDNIQYLGEACNIEATNWTELVLQSWRSLAEKTLPSLNVSLRRSRSDFLQVLFMDSSNVFVKARKRLEDDLPLSHYHDSTADKASQNRTRTGEIGDVSSGTKRKADIDTGPLGRNKMSEDPAMLLAVGGRPREEHSTDEHVSPDVESPLVDIEPPALTRLRTSCQGRRLFITDNGLIGLAASESRIGDDIYVLPGAKVPYVIRKKGRYSRLIGECYTNNFMKGEALDDPSLQLEEILIR